jgi:hypothetical protein
MNSQAKFGKETMDSRGTQEAKIRSIFWYASWLRSYLGYSECLGSA